MIRAAAKNHAHVSVCVDPSDYDALLANLGGSGESAEAVAFRRRLAWKAYQHCASYDTTVAEWLWQQIGPPPPPSATSLSHSTRLRWACGAGNRTEECQLGYNEGLPGNMSGSIHSCCGVGRGGMCLLCVNLRPRVCHRHTCLPRSCLTYG